MSQKENLSERLKEYVDGSANSLFEYFILVVIMVNVVSLGLETSQALVQYTKTFLIIDQICLWIFIFELILKVIAYNKVFFKYGWNIFDLTIVLLSIISSFSYLTIFRVFRIFRSVRVIKALKTIRALKAMKLVNGLEHLQVILKAIIYSIPGIIWTCILLFIFFYIYSIVGTNIFGPEFPVFFGTLGKSLYTLFQLMLFDDYGNITRPILQSHPWAWFYFVSFALISAFVIMNVIVGIVVDSIEAVRQRYEIEEKNEKQVTLESLSNQISELQKQIQELKTN